MGPDGGVPSGGQGVDSSGRGASTIGTGDVPLAGVAGFTGNTGQSEEPV
jgi:hypothetical protein